MGTGLGNLDSTVSEANLAYLKRRVKSGAGLIITEITEVHPLGSVVAPMCLGIWDDKFIPGLSKLADVAHAAGRKIAMQLHHCGRESYIQTKSGKAVAPSAVPSYIFGFLGTPREIFRTRSGRRSPLLVLYAAVHTREAGFDPRGTPRSAWIPFDAVSLGSCEPENR